MTTTKRTETSGIERISAQIDCSLATIKSLHGELDNLDAICRVIVDALKAGRKIMTAGNGGSAAESLHFAEELSGRFRHDRVALPGMALPADVTAITCIGNDFGFEYVFSRQVEAFGQPGDILILFTTSGNSSNLPPALEAAQARDVKVVCLLGKDGGTLAGRGDYEIIVPGRAGEHIQEAHQVILHLVLDAVEIAFT
jgi:D-sedoheptulose 7-phosphate isomerase